MSVLLLVATTVAGAQILTGPVERNYGYPERQVRQALEHLGAYTGGRLPVLEGFVAPGTAHLERFSRPYYNYEIELLPSAPGRTLVRIKARISAFYTDPQASQAEYRSLLSSGRLESDLLDRLQELVKQLAPAPEVNSAPADPASLEKQIEDLRLARADMEKTAAQLRNEIQTMQDAIRTQVRPALARVLSLEASIRSRPNATSAVLFKAKPEDMFEIVEQQGDWVRVRLAANSTGWVQRDQLASVDEPSTVRASTSPEKPLEFDVSREEVSPFLGDWIPLKGKNALFVYARPRGVLPPAQLAESKLAYAKQVFAERYRQSIHSQQNFAGVVVIFLGGNGGIAAATLRDIKQWVDGGLAEHYFIRRCSLDPPEMFNKRTP